ncbi:MAG: DUF6103 family protein [Anaerotignaceae bacterium]
MSKKENISISMESEKLRATRKYMEKREASVEQELVEALEKLYEKYVPLAVREYINENIENSAKASKAKEDKPKPIKS